MTAARLGVAIIQPRFVHTSEKWPLLLNRAVVSIMDLEGQKARYKQFILI